MPYGGSFRGIDFDMDGDADFVDDALMDEFEELEELEDEDDLDEDDEFDEDDEEFYEDELALAGLDYDDLMDMDPEERREVLEDAGLDPDDYDF